MSNALEAAKDLLAKIEEDLPLAVNEVTLPEDTTVIATIRGKSGYPVLAPHPEAISLLTGERRVFEYFALSPKVLADLIDLVERNNTASTSKKAETA